MEFLLSLIPFFSLIIMAISCLFSSVRQFQMLQQNSYFPSRYFKWLKSSYLNQLIVEAAIFLSIFLTDPIASSYGVFFACIIVLAERIINCVKIHKKSIKKLVFTPRIKRLFAAEITIAVILLVLAVVFNGGSIGEGSKAVLFGLSTVSPIFILVCWAVTLPVEKAFARYYINDAKRILKNHKNLKIIGITGSFGKTTTKFILTRILSEHFNTVCTPQSFNTPMGVVRTIRGDLKPQTQVFVCEMGAKNMGDIKEICDIVNPDYGIITSVGEQHLDTFKSVDNVFKTKFELESAVTKKGGITFICADSEEINKRITADSETVIRFGSGTDYFADNISCGAFGSRFTLHLSSTEITCETKLLGLHSISDILAAAALSYLLGVTAEEIRFAVASLKPTEHRLELKSFQKGSLLIDDAYNSNPVGCLEAVRVLGAFDGMKKTIITPGLIELGEREYDCNFALGLEAAKYCDIIILVGKNRSKPLYEGARSGNFPEDKIFTVSSFKEAMNLYLSDLDKNSVVLLENDLPDNYLN